MFVPASKNFGRFSIILFKISGKTAITLCAIWSTTGRMLSQAVITLSTKLFINPFISAFPFARPVNKFCHDDFIEPIEPDIVSLASFAVVPVIPISSWMIWIASVISAKLSIDKFAISPFASLTLLASSINLCISVLVPP